MVHQTVPVQVWADIDEGIAPVVARINAIQGARTHAACQGSMGEGGAVPYPAYVTVSWNTDEARDALEEFGLLQEGEHYGTCYPSPDILDAHKLNV